MNWPWNVRVTGRHNSLIGWQIAKPDYYRVEVRIKGRWYDAGTAKTWFEAYLMGLVA